MIYILCIIINKIFSLKEEGEDNKEKDNWFPVLEE